MAAALVSARAHSLSSAAVASSQQTAGRILRCPQPLLAPVHAPGKVRPSLVARQPGTRCRVSGHDTDGLSAGDGAPGGRRDADVPGGNDRRRTEGGRGGEGGGERLGTLADRPGAVSPFGSDVIRVGRRHPEVRRVRRLLTDTGFLSRFADDTDLYDPAMREAVRLFQDVSGLLTDGVLGPTTKDTLRRVALGAPVTQVSDFTTTVGVRDLPPTPPIDPSDAAVMTQAICALMLVGAAVAGRLMVAAFSNPKSPEPGGAWSCGCWPSSEPVRKLMYMTSVVGLAIYTGQLVNGVWQLRNTGLPALSRWGTPIFRPVLLTLLAAAVTDDTLAVRPRAWERAAIHTATGLVHALLAPFKAVLGGDGGNAPHGKIREVEEKVGRGLHEVGGRVLGRKGEGEGRERGGGEERQRGGEEGPERGGEDGVRAQQGGGERRTGGEGHEG